MLLLLYADGTAIISENRQDLQLGLNIVKNYCNKWKIILNIDIFSQRWKIKCE